MSLKTIYIISLGLFLIGSNSFAYDSKFEKAFRVCEQEGTPNSWMNYLTEHYDKKKAKNCGLTTQERFTILYYSEIGYGCINQNLRDPAKAESVRALADQLNSGLQKLPQYYGIVRRGVDLPEIERAKHVKGAVIEYLAFTSASTGYGVTHTKDLFIILSHTGRPIMGYTVANEAEVLFASNTKFKIVSIAKNKTKNFYLMREISNQEYNDPQMSDGELLSLVIEESSNKKEQALDEWFCQSKKAQLRITQKNIPSMDDLAGLVWE